MQQSNKLIYPCEPWHITETAFDLVTNYRNETTFSLSNGYIGTRGTFEESYDFDIKTGLEGNFINGFYESEMIRYGEFGYGFPKKSQSILNVPNAKMIKLFIDGEFFDMHLGELKEYNRTLHMDKGILTRDLIWKSPKGKQIKLSTTRMVSFLHKNLMAIHYEVTPLNFDGEIRIVSSIDTDVINHTADTNPLIDYGPYGRRLHTEVISSSGNILKIKARTQNTQFLLGCACTHNLVGEMIEEDPRKRENIEKENECLVTYIFKAKRECAISIDKYIAYTTSLDVEESEIDAILDETLALASEKGYAQLQREQGDYVEDFWKIADIKITGDDALQQGMRFNLFHVMQSAGRDGKTGMGAKGLSGEGYEGHYFWDTEMYIMPVFSHVNPQIAKSLLDYRYNTLDKAKQRAKEMGHPCGALYPWRTIDGSEASAYFPLGTAQYHINGDIAYAFWQYVTVTGDYTYLAEKGAEVLCETARVWADVGCFAETKQGKYCICCVTGPDEYNALVDNNFYTNLMARENIHTAIKALEYLKANKLKAYNSLINKICLRDEEIEVWHKILENMYFPYDEKLGIIPQDDGFLQKKPWDETAIPLEKRNLLYVNYHPLFVFRHRMSKQADTILGMYLHSHLFTLEEKKKNYDFYQTVTVHHSSLSTCIFGIMACEIGYYDEAYKYFTQSARMDLDDYHNNFYAGIHAANMAGTWLAIVNGFAGLRTNGDIPSFKPFIPKQWEAYEFKIMYQEALLKIAIDNKKVSYALMNDKPITFKHLDKVITLSKKGEVSNEEI